MEIKVCSKGHRYDPSVSSVCPQCAAEGGAGFFQDDTETIFFNETVPGSGMDDYGATEPVFPQGGMGSYKATEPVFPQTAARGGSDTMAVEGDGGFTAGDFESGTFFHSNGVEDYDDPTAPVIINNIAGFTPVVGWLVCVEGPSKGTDYRIRTGYNYIGRADHMDICIKGDQVIGRERHAMIAYDFEERVFFFGPADGKSIVRLNGKMVMVPSEIHAYDILKIGSTKLMFVPLCGEKFNWDE
ncbi:FHA domain-containing protein [Lachnospiraceae bacterium]|nr:FHA domain-containing protein [Lachnospiraceae bacterium]